MTGPVMESVPFTHVFTAGPTADGMTVYTVRATVSTKNISHQMTVIVAAQVRPTPTLTWPIPGLVARLALVDPDGVELGFTTRSFEPPLPAPHPQKVTVPSGVWTEIPDAGIEVHHQTVQDAVLTVFDGEVTGFDKLYRLRVRAAPDHDYDDTDDYVREE